MMMVLKSDLVSKKTVCRWYGMSFKRKTVFFLEFLAVILMEK